jgi:hypothetical protein
MYIPVFLLLFFVSCGEQKQPSTTSLNSNTVQMDTSRYAIIPYTEKDNWLFSNAKATELSSGDLEEMELLLKQATDERNTSKEEKFRTKPLERYRRQLVPVINAKGEKEVYVNCFCRNDNSSFGKEWRTKLLLIDGGGTCFFSIKINLTKKSTYELSVNGPI